MAVDSTAERWAYGISVGVMGVLLVGAAVWYLERMLFLDPAFIAFEVMNRGEFVLSEHRYGAFVTQAFPLVASRLGLPLRWVLWLYSVSFYLFYLSTLLIVGFRWRQYALGTLLTVYFTLFVSDVYFWPNNEVHQAVAWMLLFLGYYLRVGERERLRPFDHLLLVATLGLATISHPLVAAPLAFLWGYVHLCGRYEISRWVGRGLAYSVLIAGGIGVRYALSRDSWYDGQKLTGVNDLSVDRLLGTFSSGQAESVGHYFAAYYWLAVPVLFLGLYALVRGGRWWLGCGTVLAGLVYFCLVCITYPAGFGREELYYFESEWMALALIVTAPLVINYLPGRGGRWWG